MGTATRARRLVLLGVMTEGNVARGEQITALQTVAQTVQLWVRVVPMVLVDLSVVSLAWTVHLWIWVVPINAAHLTVAQADQLWTGEVLVSVAHLIVAQTAQFWTGESLVNVA